MNLINACVGIIVVICQLKQGLIGDQDLDQLGSNLHEALFLTCEQPGNVASLEANETKHISCHVPCLSW